MPQNIENLKITYDIFLRKFIMKLLVQPSHESILAAFSDQLIFLGSSTYKDL